MDSRDSNALWLIGPHATTGAAALLGLVLHAAFGVQAVGVLAGLALVPVLLVGVAAARGRYLGGIDRFHEVAYAAGCVTALGAWAAVVGLRAWPGAAVLGAAVTGAVAGWAAYTFGRRTVAVAAAAGAIVAAVVAVGVAPRDPQRHLAHAVADRAAAQEVVDAERGDLELALLTEPTRRAERAQDAVAVARDDVQGDNLAQALSEERAAEEALAAARGEVDAIVGELPETAQAREASGRVGRARAQVAARWVALWAIATAIAAAPWWARRRNRQRYAAAIDIDPLTAAITKHLHHEVKPVAGTLTVGAGGRYSVRYQLTGGKLDRQVQYVVEAVESELGWRPGALQIEGSRIRRDEVLATVIPHDPADEPIVMPALPTSITQPTPIGQHVTGEPMSVAIYTAKEGARGQLVGGRKGSGKSRFLWTELKGWTNTNDSVFMFGDLSGGATSAPWEPCSLWTETDVDRVKVQIASLRAVATARAASLPKRGWESWQPSPEHPAIVFVIDEAQALLKDDYATRAAVEQLIQVDRKSGISVVLMCPNPVNQEGISPTIREQMAVRLCFASSGQAVKWVLHGTPAAQSGDAVLHFEHPGQVLGAAPGLKPIPGRTFDTDIDEAKAIAIRNAERRPDLDELTAAVMRRVAGDVLPPALAAPTDPRPVEQTWTDDDTKAVHGMTDEQLRNQIRTDTQTPLNPLGQPWPDKVQPAPPPGDMDVPAALKVMARMVAQPGGTTPKALIEVTGMSQSFVMERLKLWVDQGVVQRPQRGRYVAVGDPTAPATAAGDGGDRSAEE